MYRLALALLILAVTPAAANAAPFGELPPVAVKDPARCLRATGAPGEVVRWAPEGAEFQQATASGFSAPVKIALGDSFLECPVATAQPTGAAVVIEHVDDGIAFAVRDPGGAWGPNQLIEDREGHLVDDPVAVVSPRGDVAVGWTETMFGHNDRNRLLVMRRPPGGQVGAPVELRINGAKTAPTKQYVVHMCDTGSLGTPGGGGHGDPRQRDAAALAADIDSGYVTDRTAYG
jgi:hypothetical protein